MTERTEAQIVAREPIRLVLGGVRKDLPPLTIVANRAWKRQLAELVSGVEFDNWGAVLVRLAGLTDEQVTLLLAYDETGSLGGRDWIETHASDEEVWEATKAVVLAAFPQLRELLKLPLAQMIPEVLRLVRAISTSSASPSGDSPPGRSMPPSPTSSSSSSPESSPSAEPVRLRPSQTA